MDKDELTDLVLQEPEAQKSNIIRFFVFESVSYIVELEVTLSSQLKYIMAYKVPARERNVWFFISNLSVESYTTNFVHNFQTYMRRLRQAYRITNVYDNTFYLREFYASDEFRDELKQYTVITDCDVIFVYHTHSGYDKTEFALMSDYELKILLEVLKEKMGYMFSMKLHNNL